MHSTLDSISATAASCGQSCRPSLHTGFGARQVRDAVEKTGQDYACVIHDAESGGYELRYQELMAPLVRAVQQLLERVAVLESALHT